MRQDISCGQLVGVWVRGPFWKDPMWIPWLTLYTTDALGFDCMVSCYDCEHFGTKCDGIVPPIEYRDRVDEFCKRFVMVKWRDQLYKPGGKTRI